MLAEFDSEVWKHKQAVRSRLVAGSGKARQQQICYFDLSLQQPVCEMFPLIRQDSFRVLLAQQGQQKPLEVTNRPSLTAILGKDPLPQQLLSRSSTPSHSFAILVKQEGTFFVYKRRRSFTSQPQLSEAVKDELGIKFQSITFEAASKKRPATGSLSGLHTALSALMGQRKRCYLVCHC